MSKVYDSWERLVAAILNREQLRHLALCESFDTSISADFSSRFSFREDETGTAASRISSNSISRGANSIQGEHIEFEELKKATRNFRPYSVLGEGAFGHFSKGWIDENTLTASEPGLGTPVAVKMCSTKGLQGVKECLKEINYLNRFRHPNIVKLIGYCSEENYMILVYEFTPKGSLDRHLFGGSHDQTMTWVTRIKVAVGVARALAFLHDNEYPIVHRSFHTADILLDGPSAAAASSPTSLRHRRRCSPHLLALAQSLLHHRLAPLLCRRLAPLHVPFCYLTRIFLS